MRTPLRRLLAFGADYLVIAVYLVVLFGLSAAALASGIGHVYSAVWSNAESAELAGFILLTVPVVLYFSIFESSPRGATPGKRILELRVIRASGEQLSLGRSLLRSAVKFLPWELAHFTVWHFVYETAGHHSPPAWTALTLGLVYLLVALFLVSLFIGREHRTVYDQIAGSRVIDVGD